MAITTSGTTLTFNDATTQTTAPVNTNANVTSATAVAGTGISVTAVTTTGAATHTVTNTGVTSVAAGTGISVSGSTGGVTITNSQPFSGSTSQLAKSWVYFTGNSGSILNSYNVSSVSHTGGGTGVVTFTTGMPSSSYAIVGMSYGIDANATTSAQSLATGSFTWYSGANNGTTDKNQVCFVTFAS